MKKNDRFVGSEFETKKHGKLIIESYVDYYNVVVMFLDTGTIATTRMDSVRDGSAVDYNRPITYGVGFRGYGKHKTGTKAHSSWSSMLARCYKESYQDSHPSYKGCTVCKDWHNYQNFADWYYENIPERLKNSRAEIDKDIKGNGKLYSPETCLIVSSHENMLEMGNRVHAKAYVFVDPNGYVMSVFNLNKFCRENGLDSSLMYKVIKGKQSNHKGYTRYVDESPQNKLQS